MYPAAKTCDINSFIPGSQTFKWHEALWLPKWGIYAYPTEDQAQNIIRSCEKLQVIRNRLGKPLEVTSWLRPENYNAWGNPYGVAGAKFSSHTTGMAVDFKALTMTPDDVRALLLPELERLKIRMENLAGSSWIHIDIRDPGGGGRYFVP